MSDELIQKVFSLIETARKSGKIAKGANEVTKAIERGHAKLVVYAEDVSPKEILMHIPILCKEKKIPCLTVPTRVDLGASAGLKVSTTAIAVINSGKSDVTEIVSLMEKEN
ncbi:MAG: ribosomal L7Ae/L30e/S12e/Gadd45 family protein [Candidatus Nanoarchaeia archaeon]|nr:ribosomal L7Ae/L30e/S12e/Gadd45 family protein [Candidatus Nanoarchaeia archaeon]